MIDQKLFRQILAEVNAKLGRKAIAHEEILQPVITICNVEYAVNFCVRSLINIENSLRATAEGNGVNVDTWLGEHVQLLSHEGAAQLLMGMLTGAQENSTGRIDKALNDFQYNEPSTRVRFLIYMKYLAYMSEYAEVLKKKRPPANALLRKGKKNKHEGRRLFQDKIFMICGFFNFSFEEIEYMTFRQFECFCAGRRRLEAVRFDSLARTGQATAATVLQSFTKKSLKSDIDRLIKNPHAE